MPFNSHGRHSIRAIEIPLQSNKDLRHIMKWAPNPKLKALAKAELNRREKVEQNIPKDNPYTSIKL